MRRHFGNALQWFYALVDKTNHYVQESLDQARSNLLSDISLEPSDPAPPPPPPPLSTPSPPLTSPPQSSSTDDQSNTRKRPSDYLHRQCPLCFGGSKIHDSNIM